MRERPFNLTPDPRFVFLSRNHREAFAHLLYGISNRAGFISLTGEVGSGKTTVLRSFLGQLDGDHYRTALILNPRLSGPQLLRSVNREMGISTKTSNGSSHLDRLNLFLLQQNSEGRTVVLVIDEAQNLEAGVLEQIRLISNLETDREKLIQIVLAGQPELVQTLQREEMRQLSQRITVRYHLQRMDFQDTAGYINHRIVAAGGRGDIFSSGALKRIYGYSRGLPRLINAACDRALLAGYTKDATRIGSGIATFAIRDLGKESSQRWRRRHLLIAASLLLMAFSTGGIYVNRNAILERFRPVRPVESPPVPTDEWLSRALVAQSGQIQSTYGEWESSRRAFNVLAGLWKVPLVPDNYRLRRLSDLEHVVRDRKLRLHRFSGNLGTLLRLDYPTVLELAVPGTATKCFVSLVGMEKDHLFIDPPIGERNSLLSVELEKHWSGQAFLFWQDPLDLSMSLSPGSRGGSPIAMGRDRIRRLQDLLREAGVFKGDVTGIFDNNTLSAIKQFQASKGIAPDGIAGDQTLMVLYSSVDRFRVPKLRGGQNEPHP